MSESNPTGFAPGVAADAAPFAGFEPFPLPEAYRQITGSEPPQGAESPQGEEPAGASQESEWDRRVREANDRATSAEQHAGQANAALQNLQGMISQAQTEALQSQARAEAQGRIDTAYQMAADMDPASALQYVRRVEDSERANLQRVINETQQQAEARLFAAVSQVAAPQYARELGSQHNLPDKYVRQLESVHPQQIDALLPFIKQVAEQERLLTQQVEQLARSSGAQEMATNGAYMSNSGSAGSTPLPALPDVIRPGSENYDSKAHLATILRRMGIMR